MSNSEHIPRVIESSASSTIKPESGFSCELQAAATGRGACVSDSENPPNIQKIEKLIKEFVAGNAESIVNYINPLVAEFSKLDSSKLSNTEDMFYRGVGRKTVIKGSRIGPSPNSGEGRYNESGEKCIYLIDNEKYLPSEIMNESGRMYVQKYKIPITKLRIADLSNKNPKIENDLQLIFQNIELGRTHSGWTFETELKSKYKLSQCVAKAFKNHNWEGLRVPGVHGKPNGHYTNLVLFGCCVAEWKTWTIDDYYAA